MTAKRIIELRNLLEDEVKKSFRTRGSVDTTELLEKFKKDQRAEIHELTQQLIDIALKKLIGDIRQRKKHALWTDSQRMLFADMLGLRQSLIVTDARGKKVNKILPKVTIGELDSWLHTQGPTSRVERHAHMANLLNRVAPFAASLSTTVEDALKNAKAGIKPEKKEG